MPRNSYEFETIRLVDRRDVFVFSKLGFGGRLFQWSKGKQTSLRVAFSGEIEVLGMFSEIFGDKR